MQLSGLVPNDLFSASSLGEGQRISARHVPNSISGHLSNLVRRLQGDPSLACVRCAGSDGMKPDAQSKPLSF